MGELQDVPLLVSAYKQTQEYVCLFLALAPPQTSGHFLKDTAIVSSSCIITTL